MKLQIAFDLLDLQKNIDLAKQLEPYADSFQIRSSLLLKYGVLAIEEFRAAFPDKEIFVETQMVNRGQDIIPMCIKAGADWISVLAGASKQVIHGASTLAGQKNKKIILDLLDTNLIGQVAMDAKKLGVDALLYHNNSDSFDNSAFTLEEWDDLTGNSNLPIYIESNINRQTLDFVISLKPECIIAGKTITQALDPLQEAAFFFAAIQKA